MIRKKHIPQRMCVACRENEAKKNLIRLVRTPEGIQIDPSGKVSGRGAYLHPKADCWQKGLKNTIAQSLNRSLSETDIERLQSELEDLMHDRKADNNIRVE